ncbi:MAG: hypothetical protein PVJ55_09660 [Anaerolineae bacterium]
MKTERVAATKADSGSATMARELASLLEGGDRQSAGPDLSDEARAELQALRHLADRLAVRMKPVRPAPAFVRSLGDELVGEAERRMAKRERRHHIAVIGAAVAGGLVSIASLVGGAVVLVKWLRTREGARQASTV